MIAIDTNVLVRILIDDPGQSAQVKLARQFAEKHRQLFVPQLVQVELIWVLDFSYKMNKIDILKISHHLYENDAFVLQYEEQFEAALQLFQTTNVNFSDALILQACEEEGCQLVTFDKKFSKLPNVKLLER
jgi:predicted nucleic-acid-binding protein